MWLIRFHLIETRDYNKIDRILKDFDCLPKRVSTMLYIKGITLYILEKKSWRKIAEQLSVPYLSLYHFYNNIKDAQALSRIFLYLIERRIILFIGDEKNITEQLLMSQVILEKSRSGIVNLL